MSPLPGTAVAVVYQLCGTIGSVGMLAYLAGAVILFSWWLARDSFGSGNSVSDLGLCQLLLVYRLSGSPNTRPSLATFLKGVRDGVELIVFARSRSKWRPPRS